MSEHKRITWTGKSGKEYTYIIYGLGEKFKADQLGNYIYCKLNAEQMWAPVYIGQGDLKEGSENQLRAECIGKNGATHLHVHLNKDDAKRVAEERDLLEQLKSSFAPNGCNDKDG